MNPDGTQPESVPAPSGAAAAVYSPDGKQIAFRPRRNDDIFTMPDGRSQPTNPASRAVDRSPDWQPIPTQVIFVHGFLGSKIFCDSSELWPGLPLPGLKKMELNSDGRTNANCASAGPHEGQLLEKVAGGDIYGSTVDFLKSEFPNSYHLFAWDWRKSPDEAIVDLDALVEKVRPPGGKVVLVGHSMGGLVIRLYINDPAHANKVSRVLTAGTPYWGSPKALFPFLYGEESPGTSSLDAIFAIDKLITYGRNDLRHFARYLQGLFFLWPSAHYGGWLSIEGRKSPLDTKALLDFVEEFGGNRSLLSTALGAHAQRIDDFATNGVDYQVVAGTGVNTIGSVNIEKPPQLLQTIGSLFDIADRDIVHVEWVNGDGTVPLKSALAATPTVRRHYTCGVEHVPLPGHPAFTSRARAFIAGEGPFEDPGTPTQRLCDPTGFALSVFPLEGTVFASAASARVKTSASAPLTIDKAEQRGLISAVAGGKNIEAATSAGQPLTFTISAKKGAVLRVAPLVNGKRGKTQLFLARKGGTLTIELAGKVTVKLGRKKLKALKDDKRAPKTRVRIKKRGKKFVLTFKVKDASPTSTYVQLGKKKRAKRLHGKKLKLSASQLRKGIRYQSIDALGNAGKSKRIRKR